MSLQCYTGELFPRLEDYLIILGNTPVLGSAIKALDPVKLHGPCRFRYCKKDHPTH